ncbi:TPA: hypothetical protein DF272_01170 [Candidatus Falkowbacteria bacterium]|nr:hypothetical protein [Candidatus Falkowbacteria bacterium]
MFDSKDVEKNKVLAAVGYLGILCLIPLLLARDSQYAKFHGKQGLILFIAEVIISLVNVIPILGQVIWLIAFVYFIIMTITGIIKALNGEKWVMPILGHYTDKINI